MGAPDALHRGDADPGDLGHHAGGPMRRLARRVGLGQRDYPLGDFRSRVISTVPRPAAVNRMIRARQTCFCGVFRSATIASRRARSAALTLTTISLRIPPDSHLPTLEGIRRALNGTT